MLRIGPARIGSAARVVVVATVAALALSGCFQYSDVLTLQTDGSGTYSIDLKVDRAALASAATMNQSLTSGAGADTATGDEALDLPTRAELEAALAKGAPGVKLTDYRELSDEHKRGFHAEATFGSVGDLTQLHTTLAEIESVGSEAQVRFAYERNAAGEWSFRRSMGSAQSAQAMAMLPMLLGQSDGATDSSRQASAPDDPLAKARELQAILGQLMPGVGDLHVRFEVHLPGTVAANNATLVHDRVALWEYDFAHLLAAASSGTLEMSAVVKP